jgi:hypothetical protein
VGLGFELRASHLKAGTPSLQPHLQSILFWLFWRWGLMNYLPRLASNLDSLILPISASWVARITGASHWLAMSILLFMLVHTHTHIQEFSFLFVSLFLWYWSFELRASFLSFFFFCEKVFLLIMPNQPGVMNIPVIPVIGRLRQDNHKFKASLCQKKKKKKGKTQSV